MEIERDCGLKLPDWNGGGVNTRKANESFLIGETRHVADFGNKLRTENGANAK